MRAAKGEVMIDHSRSNNTLTDTFATLLDPSTFTTLLDVDARGLVEKTFVIENTGGANGATVRIRGSVDGGANFDEDIQAATNIAFGAKLVVKTSDYYTDIKVDAHRQGAGLDTSVDCRFAGRRNDVSAEIV